MHGKAVLCIENRPRQKAPRPKSLQTRCPAASGNLDARKRHIMHQDLRPTTNRQLPTANRQLPTTDYRLPTANCRLPTTDCRQQEFAAGNKKKKDRRPFLHKVPKSHLSGTFTMSGFACSSSGQDWKRMCSRCLQQEHPLLSILSYWARRKPRLLLRLSGELLLRFETRQFLALLFQLPPRLTRLEPFILHHINQIGPCCARWHHQQICPKSSNTFFL